jgi:hypothetical protein
MILRRPDESLRICPDLQAARIAVEGLLRYISNTFGPIHVQLATDPEAGLRAFCAASRSSLTALDVLLAATRPVEGLRDLLRGEQRERLSLHESAVALGREFRQSLAGWNLSAWEEERDAARASMPEEEFRKVRAYYEPATGVHNRLSEPLMRVEAYLCALKDEERAAAGRQSAWEEKRSRLEQMLSVATGGSPEERLTLEQIVAFAGNGHASVGQRMSRIVQLSNIPRGWTSKYWAHTSPRITFVHR